MNIKDFYYSSMKTFNNTEKEFLSELKKFLRKYGAEIELVEDGDSDNKINIFAYTQYDRDGHETQECIDIDITSINGREVR